MSQDVIARGHNDAYAPLYAPTGPRTSGGSEKTSGAKPAHPAVDVRLCPVGFLDGHDVAFAESTQQEVTAGCALPGVPADQAANVP